VPGNGAKDVVLRNVRVTGPAAATAAASAQGAEGLRVSSRPLLGLVHPLRLLESSRTVALLSSEE
jgi:hypothetical protein